MSQQAAAGRGAGRGGGGHGPQYYPRKWGVDHALKAYKSAISKITEHTFNTGHKKYAAQFTRSCEEIANYVQRTLTDEGYLVAETIRTGKEQTALQSRCRSVGHGMLCKSRRGRTKHYGSR